MSNQKQFEEAMRGSTKEALQMTFERVAQLPPPQVFPYLTQMTLIAVELLRAGGQRDEFVREFLAEATRSLDNPPFLTMTDLRVN
ncbi:hypothetical protein [Stenotrophomonas maltophilia]|uniref:hypothetical protein n=1 Tax=Stenotrophomonas maltophilia TaxID=40324 RepID=UPI0015DF71A0|nr:hypothetical protein [Stenotrophomonas maltophilia]MBA0448695.1 hypothetical protein [Stenotrophomonas maltophilia]